MQQLFKHITMISKLDTVVASVINWTLNYASIAQSRLGGDRFEPTTEGCKS
jgi:hypothetical protein